MPSPPCKTSSRRLPNWKADARGVPRGRREQVVPRRYVVSPDPSVPCEEHDGTGGGRTGCYAEHSKRRKSCRLLGMPASMPVNFSPNLYVYGLTPPFEGPDRIDLACSTFDPIMYETIQYDSRREPIPDGSVVVLGPYATGERGTTLKCIPVDLLQAMSGDADGDVQMLGSRFEVEIGPRKYDSRVPNEQMLYDCVQTLEFHGIRMGGMIVSAVVTLLRNEQYRKQMELHLSRDESGLLQRKVRLLARLFFHLAMYLRRWAGPGRPYPIAYDRTRDNVGSPTNPVSASLRGKSVVAGSSGVRVVKQTHSLPAADDLSSGTGRLEQMENAHLRAISDVLETLSEEDQAYVRLAFKSGTRYEMVGEDGFSSGYWTTTDSLVDMCLSPVHSVAAGDRCIRMTSADILYGVLTVIPHLYATPPTWTRFEEDDIAFIA